MLCTELDCGRRSLWCWLLPQLSVSTLSLRSNRDREAKKYTGLHDVRECERRVNKKEMSIFEL